MCLLMVVCALCCIQLFMLMCFVSTCVYLCVGVFVSFESPSFCLSVRVPVGRCLHLVIHLYIACDYLCHVTVTMYVQYVCTYYIYTVCTVLYVLYVCIYMCMYVCI